jgi:N-acetylmuramoyl-L-alanine amidase/FG-GAP-like repeat
VTGKEGEGDEIALQAGSVTPRPTIYSRAQWGADESQRDSSSLHYNEVHAGFVHHTVTANDYTRAEVPGIIRSIYAYHTRSRGWSDVGYNFLIDRFGRVWEGRAGGVDRPVVGAHTLNYNDYAFAAAAIGNFETARPSSPMLTAYGELFAWKLSLHGINPASTRQRVGSRYFAAINGHQDAAATACPGKYLYAKLPTIRSLAVANQEGWSGRELDGDLASTSHADIVVRRASNKMAYIIPTGGLTGFYPPATSASGWSGYSAVVASADLTGDGQADVVARDGSGITRVYAGDRARFGAGKRATKKFAKVKLITAAGDLNRDRLNDLVAVRASDGRLVAYLGTGKGTFNKRVLRHDFSGYNLLTGAGDVTGDGRPDLAARTTSGRIYIHHGGDLGRRSAVAGNYPSIDAMVGMGDYTRDGRPDLVLRSAKGRGFVLPSRSNGTFGHLVGPVASLTGLTGLSGGIQITGHSAADLVARSGDNLVVVRARGTFHTGKAIATGTNLASVNKVLNVGDWDRDGHGDIVTRKSTNGALELRRGNGKGKFANPTTLSGGFASVGMLTAVGDLTGDGYPDLMGQPSGGNMRIYPGRGAAGLGSSYVAYRAVGASRQFGVGRWNGDGSPDTLIRVGDSLRLYVGNGPGGLTGYRTLPIDLARYDWVGGIRNLRGQGHPALIVRNRTTGDLWGIPANSARFGKPRFLAEGFDAYDLIS